MQAPAPSRTFCSVSHERRTSHSCVEITRSPRPRSPQELGLGVLVPAYVLSELKAGFQIGAVLFLPFLMIDIVVASVTLSIGMVQLPPVMVSAPVQDTAVRAGGRLEPGGRFADEELPVRRK